MKIIKYKKIGKSKYKVFFDKTDMILYEDVIIKYKLLSIENININLLEKITEDNKYYEAYDKAINYVSIKLRNELELKKYLEKSFDEKLIFDVINKLKKNGYLNDNVYINAYIHDKILLSTDGPIKIKEYLLNNGFEEKLIDQTLNKIEENIWIEKIKKTINKKNNTGSSYNFVLKMQNELYYKGYPKELVNEVLKYVDLNDDLNLNKEIKKNIEKYKKKYRNSELKNRVIKSLLIKGYSYENIIRCYEEIDEKNNI